MKNQCKIVKDKFPLYERLLLGVKTTQGRDFYISKLKPSNVKWRVDILDVDHSAEPLHESKLHTEVGIKDTSKFKFLIFADGFPSPLVNFDSSGITHRNDKDVPLAEQIITTPHFNRYDENGIRYAYKTPELKDPTISAQISDINNCIIHFYDEFNIHHNPAGYPSVLFKVMPQQEMFDIKTNDDPLAHVTQF